MRTRQILLCLLASLTAATRSRAGVQLWNGIEAETPPEALENRLFQDTRRIFHGLSRQFTMTDFYIQPNDPVTVQIVFDHNSKNVCGVDIEGVQSTQEWQALLAELGAPARRIDQDATASQKRSTDLKDGRRLFPIWRWRKNATLITFEDRDRSGYFFTAYRWVESDGHAHFC